MITPQRNLKIAKYTFPLYAVILLTAAFLVSCDREEVNSAEELKSYVREPANNLTQKTILNGYEVSVSYKPADLLIYQEIGGDPIDHQKLFNIEKKYRDKYYFVVSVVKNASIESESEQSRFRDLSASLTQFLSITTSDNDTLREDGLSVEGTNLLNGSTEIIFVVSKEKTKSREWIQFNLDEFGLGLGDREFKFHIHDLEAVPKLKFELIS